MAKYMKSFRMRMLLLFGISMLLSGTLTFSLYKVLQYYYRTEVYLGDPLANVRAYIGRIGDINFFLLIFIPLAILFFFMLTKSYSIYFQKISEGIHELANGNFHNRVDIVSNDEFGKIAADINMASEKLQRAIEREEIAENSKDQLVVNLAHDLRTPLTSVLGYLNLVLNDNSLSSDQQNHYTSIALSKSQRLEKLIDELFEITKLNYGELKIKKSDINIGELLMQLTEELYPMLESNSLEARLEIDSDLDIFGDGELLARVFENLLTNAIRYGFDGLYIDVNGKNEGEYVVIQVVNYGDPISETELPYVFDMFYSGDKARTHHDGSTGLGLFIAKSIVEKHNGTISVQSNPLRTLFEVRLPKI